MYNEKKNQTIKTDPEMTQVIELVDKGIKSIITVIPHMFKELAEKLNILNKDMEDIKMTKIELLEMKPIMLK